MTRASLLALICLPLLATPAWSGDIKANYRCNDGTKLVATFHNPAQGTGSLGLYFTSTRQTLNLLQGLSADGGRYVSGKTQFWIKGNQATLTRGGRNVICQTKA